MRFPAMFKRFKPASGTEVALGSDVPPTLPPSSQPDNLLACRFSNVNGWPVHRIAVICKYVGTGSPSPLTGDMYLFETQTQSWHRINKDTVDIVPGVVTFFDVVALLDMPNTLASLDAALAGSISSVLVVADPNNTANGEYDIAMGPDLTTFP